MKLPTAFVTAMQQRLGEEFEAFFKSYEEAPYAGLRINTIKTNVSNVLDHIPYKVTPIPWTRDGFYTPQDARPGKHPLYYAGMYYIQEPSAMAPVELLDVQPGEYVLDLCAAPGGKSVQIGAGLQGTGVLVTNDIHPDRTKALVRNMELYGVTRSIVLNEQPERIAAAFPGYFDKVLVDAPCSGEGMFRKDPDMVRSWEREPVTSYSAMQQDILNAAAKAVAPGGTLVYSTCTFSPEENEASIARFLTKHPEFHVKRVELKHGWANGRPDWAQHCMGEHGWEAAPEAIQATQYTIRLWPHRLHGEGHYVAVLVREGERLERHDPMSDALEVAISASLNRSGCSHERIASERHKAKPVRKGQKDTMKSAKPKYSAAKKGLQAPAKEELEAYQAFCNEHFTELPAKLNVMMNAYGYCCPISIDRLTGLRVVRPGWFLGTFKPQRFEPAHALALGLKVNQAKRQYALCLESEKLIPYLRGDTLTIDEEELQLHMGAQAKGYVLLTLMGCPLGFGKWVDRLLKNEYPAAWRWNS